VINTHQFYCYDIFDVTTVNPKCNIPFLNLKFDLKKKYLGSPCLKGPGLYALCFRDEICKSRLKSKWTLIYVGKFRGETNNPFAGNVAKTRWWTHLASITMRGHKVSVSKSTLASVSLYGTHLGKSLKAECRCITKKSNCQSSLNRTIFAINYWKRFYSNCVNKNPNKILKHFKFIYLQYAPKTRSSLTATSIKKIRKEISLTEDFLIKKLSPPCNNVESKAQYTCDAATKSIFLAMKKRLCGARCRNFHRGKEESCGCQHSLALRVFGMAG